MTPFQKALLESTETQFDNVPEEAAIDIIPTPQFTREAQRIGKKHRLRKTLRRVGLVAAVFVLLIGTVLAVKLFPDWGAPELSQFSMHMEDGSENFHIKMDFDESFVSPDAPDHIETYYMPTIIVSPETVVPGNTYFESSTSTYHPFFLEDNPYPGNTMPEDAIIETNYCWNIDGNWISFSQCSLKRGKIRGRQWVYSAEHHPQVNTETFTIDSYDIFCITIESDYGPVYIWFWTDGDYLFSLYSASEDMTELLRSIRPMEDMSPYLEPDLPFHTLP